MARQQIATLLKLMSTRGERFTNFVSEVNCAAPEVSEVRSSAPLGDTGRAWAAYLNRVHNAVHPIFADQVLAALDSLPFSYPLETSEPSVHFLISLDASDGNVVHIRTIENSGKPEFDAAAQLSLRAAAPYGKPSAQLVSYDGLVHFAWRLHRRFERACSTFFITPLFWPSAEQNQ